MKRGSCYAEHLGWESATFEPSAKVDLSGGAVEAGDMSDKKKKDPMYPEWRQSIPGKEKNSCKSSWVRTRQVLGSKGRTDRDTVFEKKSKY